jgi:hypothetical protein
MRNKKGLKVQLDSTRVKLQNVRDRWLLNSRSVDYEAFLKSVFLLIHSKKEATFAQKTKMTDGVIKDFQNLENYIE